MRRIGNEATLPVEARLDLLRRCLQPVEHAVEARREALDFVLSLGGLQTPAKVTRVLDLVGGANQGVQGPQRPAGNGPRHDCGSEKGDDAGEAQSGLGSGDLVVDEGRRLKSCRHARVASWPLPPDCVEPEFNTT